MTEGEAISDKSGNRHLLIANPKMSDDYPLGWPFILFEKIENFSFFFFERDAKA